MSSQIASCSGSSLLEMACSGMQEECYTGLLQTPWLRPNCQTPPSPVSGHQTSVSTIL